MTIGYIIAGTPGPKMVEFRFLVGVAIAPVSKKLAVKYNVNGKLRHEKIGF